MLTVPRGAWTSSADAAAFAFVIVDGLLAREISLRDHYMLELLGPGDVLQPTVPPGPRRLATETRLTALSDLLLLVLGDSFVQAAGMWPSLLVRLQHRLETQRESLAIQGVIAHFSRAEQRLLLMLWHLADRWGYVTPDGVVLPLPLNHELLGQLIAARRPTVTLALRSLEDALAVRRRDDGSWLLTGTADAMVTSIVKPRIGSHSLGKRLLLAGLVNQRQAEARALRAEADQIRVKGPAPGPLRHRRSP